MIYIIWSLSIYKLHVFLVKMLQIFNQLQSGLSRGESIFPQSDFSSDDYMDLEAQKKIAENIRYTLIKKINLNNIY